MAYRFEIIETTSEQFKGSYLLWTPDTHQWLLKDNTMTGSGQARAAELYYYATREEAETVLIAAKLRGDAL